MSTDSPTSRVEQPGDVEKPEGSPVDPVVTGAIAPKNERYHAFDLFRGCMMLLGLVLHSACNYMAMPPRESWPFRDNASNPVFDFAVVFIHFFRMPGFFLMAGFFGSLLCARRGVRGFATNRLKRVLLPFLLGWVFVCPVAVAGFVFAKNAKAAGLSAGWDAALNHLLGAEFLNQPTILHLWFLCALLVLYPVALFFRAIAGRLPGSIDKAVTRIASRLLTRFWGAPALGVVTMLIMAPLSSLGFETVSALPLPVRTLMAYAFFFAMGWLFYRCPDDVLHLAQGWAWRLIAGAGLLTISTLNRFDDPAGFGIQLWPLFITCTGVWLTVLGLIGFFVRYLNRPLAGSRYVADASYWIYLVHLPIVIVLAGLLTHVEWSAWTKFTLVLGGASGLCLLSYQLCVRPTPIGQLLNGRRHPWLGLRRRVPARDISSKDNSSAHANLP